MKRQRSHKNKKKTVSEKKGLGTKVVCSPNGNHILDNVKCHECGKCGHYKKQCPEKEPSPMQSCKEGNCNLDNKKKCYKCEKYGHYVKQCPENRISSSVLDREVLTTAATTNLEGNCNLDNKKKCYKCEKYGHYVKQCPENRISSSLPDREVLTTATTTNLEGGNTTQFGAPATLSALPTPLGNRHRGSVKCYECGKRGHYQNQCVKCFQCGKWGHYQNQCDSVKCFECGKTGHYQNQCPKNKRSSPVQAYEALLTVTTTNSEGGNMSKHETLATLPTLPTTVENHNPDYSMCYERGMDGHFQNECVDSKVSAPTQANAALPTAATTDLEGFEFMQQPSAGTFGSPSDQSSPFASSPAFGMTSSKSALFGSASTPSACDVQNTSSLSGSSNSSAFKNSTQLTPAFGATGTSASEQQSTSTAVGLNSNQSSPPVSKAITSNTLFGVPSQYAFGAPSTSVFGQSSTTVVVKAYSMPALFGSTATTMPTLTSAFGFKSSGQTTTPGNRSSTPGNQMTMHESQTTISESQTTTSECQMTTPGNQATTPGNQVKALGNQTTTPESQTTTPECQTATCEYQTGISDEQKSIKTPYSSTQNTNGKSVFVLDKSTLKGKHYEELGREDYHGDKGYDREQVQAWGQTQSSPIGMTNIASSFDRSPKILTPKPPVVVMSEDSGSGDTPYKVTKTSVWWDIENCQVPRGSDTYYIAQNISSALADAGYKGAVTISAYGDTHKIPKAVQQALSSTGIALNHVPAGVKDASDKKILVDMLFWAVDNPPPANYLLISGDRDFSNALHQLRLRRYNILLAHAPSVSQALVAAAKKVWQWSSLLSGGPPLRDLETGTKISSANKSSFNGIKGPIAKRLKWNDQNARETQKTFSVSPSEEDCDIRSEKLASLPRVSMPEVNEITGLKRASISIPSGENVCAKRPRNSLDSLEQMPFETVFHLEKNPFNTHPFKVAQLFAPSNSAPSQNTTNNSFITQPHHQRIIFGPPHLQSMFNKPTLNHHQNIKPPQLFNGHQVHSNEVHRHIGYIVSALAELKANKIAPTEENISNCICYGMGKQSIDVKSGLAYACENNMLTRYNLENGISVYMGKNEQFWECVNVLNNDKHSEETWNAVRNFLSSASGQLAISSTECRYHAATVLKKSCLQHLPLGDVLQLLNMVVIFRKWIIPSPSGWQPLKFTIKVLPSGNAKH